MTRVSQCTPANQKNYDPPFYRVVFASGSPIGIPFLEQIAEDDRFELVGVLTAPDKPAGRGMKLQQNPVKKAALKHLDEKEIQTPSSLRTTSKKHGEAAKEIENWLEELAPDFLVVVAYGQILPERVLQIPRI